MFIKYSTHMKIQMFLCEIDPLITLATGTNILISDL